MPASLIENIPDAPKVDYHYVTSGDKMRLSNYVVTGNMGNETFAYGDSYGRLSQVTQTFTGRESYPLVTNYNWDSLSRLQKLTYPLRHSIGEAGGDHSAQSEIQLHDYQRREQQWAEDRAVDRRDRLDAGPAESQQGLCL